MDHIRPCTQWSLRTWIYNTKWRKHVIFSAPQTWVNSIEWGKSKKRGRFWPTLWRRMCACSYLTALHQQPYPLIPTLPTSATVKDSRPCLASLVQRREKTTAAIPRKATSKRTFGTKLCLKFIRWLNLSWRMIRPETRRSLMSQWLWLDGVLWSTARQVKLLLEAKKYDAEGRNNCLFLVYGHTAVFIQEQFWSCNFDMFMTELIKCHKHAQVFLNEAYVHTSLLWNNCKI